MHKLIRLFLTASFWITSQDSIYSQMYNKVFSIWLPSYIKDAQPILDLIFGNFPHPRETGNIDQKTRIYILAEYPYYGQRKVSLILSCSENNTGF